MKDHNHYNEKIATLIEGATFREADSFAPRACIIDGKIVGQDVPNYHDPNSPEGVFALLRAVEKVADDGKDWIDFYADEHDNSVNAEGMGGKGCTENFTGPGRIAKALYAALCTYIDQLQEETP